MLVSGKITEEVAITTITATVITATEAEALPGAATIRLQTEVVVITTATQPLLVTTPRATAIRAMDQGAVDGRLGEGEVIMFWMYISDAGFCNGYQTRFMFSCLTVARTDIGRGRGRGRAAGRGPLYFPDPDDIKFLKVMKGHSKKVTCIAVNPDAQQVHTRS